MPKEDRIIVKGMHDPIIDEETFSIVQEMIKNRTNLRVKTYDWLLKGIIVCKECGNKMGVITQRYAQKSTFYLRCNTYASNTTLKLCKPHISNLEKITDIVIKKIKEKCKEFLENDKCYNLTGKLKAETLSNTRTLKNELIILKQNIKEINKKIDKIFEDKYTGLLEDEDFRRIYNKQLEARKTIEKRIENLEKVQEKDESFLDINKIASEFLKTKEITKNQLSQLVEKVEISADKRIYITYKFSILNEKNLRKFKKVS